MVDPKDERREFKKWISDGMSGNARACAWLGWKARAELSVPAKHTESFQENTFREDRDVFDWMGDKIMQRLIETAEACDNMEEPFRSGVLTGLEEFYFRMTGKHFDWEEIKPAVPADGAAEKMTPADCSNEFKAGRLFQFRRMKLQRPIDPVYWDAHEEKELSRAPLEDIPAKDDDMTAKQMLLDRMVASFPKRDQSELKREIAQMSWAERLTKYEELRLASSVIPCGTSNVTMVDPTQFQKAVAPAQTFEEFWRPHLGSSMAPEMIWDAAFLAGQRSRETK
jgi:hypothetical protein